MLHQIDISPQYIILSHLHVLSSGCRIILSSASRSHKKTIRDFGVEKYKLRYNNLSNISKVEPSLCRTKSKCVFVYVRSSAQLTRMNKARGETCRHIVVGASTEHRQVEWCFVGEGGWLWRLAQD
ncbi:hypothetical protein Tco_0984020 [Tanacetum coccineum]